MRHQKCIFTLFILMNIAGASSSETCERPGDLQNGRLNMKARTKGTIITFTCNEGYWLNGNNKLTCEPTLEWSGKNPTCVAFQCPPLDEPAHGILRYPTLEYKPNVTVICDPGFRYSLQGSETISCRKNDTWSRTVGKCKAIKCPEFPALENGWVEQQNRVVGGYATFKCYDKFMYSLPKQTLRCRPNGEWNGKNGTCDKAICSDLPDVAHGKLRPVDRVTKIGTKAVIKCDDGYVIDKIQTIECEQSGKWTSIESHCKEKPCQTLQKDIHGDTSALDGKYGDAVTRTCSKGFPLVGPKRIWCNADGNWSADLGVCFDVGQTELRDWLIVVTCIEVILCVFAVCIICIICVHYNCMEWFKKRFGVGRKKTDDNAGGVTRPLGQPNRQGPNGN